MEINRSFCSVKVLAQILARLGHRLGAGKLGIDSAAEDKWKLISVFTRLSRG